MGPSNVNHGAVNLEEQIKEIERERERGPHAGSELIASTRHKNLSEKGPGLQREKRREEQKNYKHAACEKACDDVRLPHNTEHQPPRHHACMLEII